jgi:hypothetical protein
VQAAIDKLEETVVLHTYWHVASKRYEIYEKRLRGEPPPWTEDTILRDNRFTNVFRATDRVSQYLIREVIYQSGGSMDDSEIVFRVLHFKLFNSIAAWKALKAALRYVPSWERFDLQRYARILDEAKSKGVKIWNAAYTQRPQTGDREIDEKYAKSKHRAYLALLEKMMREDITDRLKAAKTYKEAFNVLRRPGLYGDFTAMQHLTDLDYSPTINFSEDDFIVAGPGALDGLQKCFVNFGRQPEVAAEIIRRFVERQEGFFADVGLKPVRLCGQRRLTLIDAQNLFCETDKYARVAHPDIKVGRTDIKQRFCVNPEPPPPPFFPPKWGLSL